MEFIIIGIIAFIIIIAFVIYSLKEAEEVDPNDDDF